MRVCGHTWEDCLTTFRCMTVPRVPLYHLLFNVEELEFINNVYIEN